MASTEFVKSPTPPESGDELIAGFSDEETLTTRPQPPSSPESLPRSAGAGSGAEDNTHLRSIKGHSVVRGSRLRMRTFLEHLLETEEVEGLEYTDQHERIFRLPWKHAKSTGYEPERDGKLFKLWALNTGKLRAGESDDDKPIWKVNFRCALKNVQNTVVEIGEGPTDGDYKVFQFKNTELTEDDTKRLLIDTLPDRHAQAPQCKPECCWPDGSALAWRRRRRNAGKLFDSVDAPAATHMPMAGFGIGELPPAPTGPNKEYFDMLMSAYPTPSAPAAAVAGSATPPCPVTDLSAATLSAGSAHHQHQLTVHPAMTSQAHQINASPVASTAAVTMDTSHSLWTGNGNSTAAAVTADLCQTQPPPAMPMSLESHQPFSALSRFPQQYLNQILQGATTHNLISYEMYVKVAYRGCAMAAMRVTHREGCRLFYGHPPQRNMMDVATQERLFGSRKLLQLSLPQPRTAQNILPSMWLLLEHTHRGIIMQMEANDIYITRLCPAHVYFANQDGEVIAVERSKRTRVFSYAKFCETYERYKSMPGPGGRLIAGEAPCYEVLLSIGQHWGAERHRDNNLISLNVTHSLGEKMIESLRQEFFKNRAPFDTDYMSVDDMDEDDKRAKAAMEVSVRAQVQRASLAAGTGNPDTKPPSSAASGSRAGAGVGGSKAGASATAKNMRKSKDKRAAAKQSNKAAVSLSVGRNM